MPPTELASTATTLSSTLAINKGGTGGTTALAARTNLSAAASLSISGSTLAAVCAEIINAVPQGGTAIFIASSAGMSALTGAKVSGVCTGTVHRSDSNLLRFIAANSAGNYMYSWSISSASTSGGTIGSVYRYSGTAL